jgi:hypothetical protein
MKKFLFLFALGLIFVLVACALPSTAQPTDSSPDAASLQPAQVYRQADIHEEDRHE